MADRKLSIVSNVILPLVVFVSVVVLFFVFKPDEAGKLFYFNMCYTILLIAIFFFYLGFIRVGHFKLSTAFNAIIGVYALFYIIGGASWMLIYSLLLTARISFNVYISVLLVFTLLWLIVSTLLAQTDTDYKKTTDELHNQGYSLQFFTQKINTLASRYEKICLEKGIAYKTDSNNRTIVDKLKSKISFLTPNVFRNEMACSQLNAILDKCGELIDETEIANEEQIATVEKNMQRFISNSLDELDMLKNMTNK